MNRREFSVALAGMAAFPSFGSGGFSQLVILKAIAGPQLPETLAIRTNVPEKMRGGVWELRTYRINLTPTELAIRFANVFPRAGIRPVLWKIADDRLTFLIPFESLATRDRAWTTLNADPEWISDRPRFQSYHFGLYRAV
jgi:hypothetical protein